MLGAKGFRAAVLLLFDSARSVLRLADNMTALKATAASETHPVDVVFNPSSFAFSL